jgi:hypothetical protein
MGLMGLADLGQGYADPAIDWSHGWADDKGRIMARYGPPGEIDAPSGYGLPMQLQSMGLDPRLAWSWWAQWATPWAGYSRYATQAGVPSPPPEVDFAAEYGMFGLGAGAPANGLLTKRNLVIGGVLAALLYAGSQRTRKGAVRLRNPVKGAERVIKLVMGTKKRRKQRRRGRRRRR